MYTENGMLVDLTEIRNVVQNADVFAIGFRLFPERLLIDTRLDEADISGPCATPMVAIVDPVATVQERFFWLGQHRPTLGMPQNFMFFFWPHSIGYLEESGVWDEVRMRLRDHAGAMDTCDAALRDLLERERAANVEAIFGSSRYHTVWSLEA